MDGDRIGDVITNPNITKEQLIHILLEMIGKFNELKIKYSEIIVERDEFKNSLDNANKEIERIKNPQNVITEIEGLADGLNAMEIVESDDESIKEYARELAKQYEREDLAKQYEKELNERSEQIKKFVKDYNQDKEQLKEYDQNKELDNELDKEQGNKLDKEQSREQDKEQDKVQEQSIEPPESKYTVVIPPIISEPAGFEEAAKKTQMVTCIACSNQFHEAVIKLYQGVCKKCFNTCNVCHKAKPKSRYWDNTHAGTICVQCIRKRAKNNKEPCGKCKKLFLTKTLKKYKGYCSKCATSLGKEKMRSTTALRIAVWNKYIGPDERKGKCYVCECEIRLEEFQMAHVVSEYDGGEKTIDNLRPTCAPCNNSCRTANLDEFKIQFQSRKK